MFRELHSEKGNSTWEKGRKRPQSHVLTRGLGAAAAAAAAGTGQSFSKLEDKKSNDFRVSLNGQEWKDKEYIASTTSSQAQTSIFFFLSSSPPPR